LIDLLKHQGVHPRVGAADVVPFVPLSGSTIQECIEVAHRAGRELWRRFGVPVYFYESAARSESRRRLEKVRRRGFDGKPPDIGDTASHPTAGASIVGARDFLIASNVNLATGDVAVAQRIARKIRESSGRFPFVKAMGRPLASRGRAQVSTNLLNSAETDLNAVYDAIAAEAPVESCQLVGLMPRRALQMFPEFFHRAANFDESRVIENRIAKIEASARHH
jgi:glutamate formiminotransferase